MDPKARQVALQIGGSRVALGTAIFLATRPALRAMRFAEPGPTGVALAKLGGGRDIAIGALTLASLGDAERLRTVLLASNLCDLADAAAFAFAARDPQMRAPGISGVLSGSAAAAAGFWSWRRLGD
jgi:hypothetical protein